MRMYFTTSTRQNVSKGVPPNATSTKAPPANAPLTKAQKKTFAMQIAKTRIQSSCGCGK